ncbi:signal recognition particle [Vibrio sp. 05-20-BW147]|uniref:signal recognition particle n=1 Tax=Vibrio sp. 05-20-BW147 TaxID=2575834 RepID=UPI0020CBF76C|nr:signal recognition particle [Vibrio sp. 05-20-BW147]
MASASFSVAATSETRILTPDQNWMPVTDLNLPRQMKIGTLDNGMRFVVMPSRAAQNALSLRFELQTSTNQTWLVAQEADLSQTQLKEGLLQLREQIEVNGKLPSTPNSTQTLILVGDVNVKDAIDQIDIVFSSAEMSNSAPVSLFNPTPKATEETQAVAVRLIATSAHDEMDDDSKMYRKEATKRHLADDVLVARVEKQLIDANVAVVSVKATERWNRVQLISSIIVELNDASQISQAKEVLSAALHNARNGNVSADEFAAQVQLRHERLKRELKSTTAQQADEIAKAIRFNRIYVQPSDELRLFEFHIAHMTEADVNEAMIIHWSQRTQLLTHITGN